jgi:hypothetical protein
MEGAPSTPHQRTGIQIRVPANAAKEKPTEATTPKTMNSAGRRDLKTLGSLVESMAKALLWRQTSHRPV